MDGTNTKAVNFSVFELSPTGCRERLIARLSVFEDARRLADLANDKRRVVVHLDEVVWPRQP